MPTATVLPTATPKPVGKANLAAVKDYLLGNSAKLGNASAELKKQSDAYFELMKGAKFNAAVAWKEKPSELKSAILAARNAWMVASPLYEQIEGIVAGVPSLAEFDVTLDAGASAADGGENVVNFDLKLGDGRVLRKPGNLFGVTESTLWGTFPAFSLKQQADWNGNGSIEFGETLPDPYVLKAGVDEMERQVGLLQQAAKAWEPTPSDAFTALVVMVPTMDEYFAAWKDSRFISDPKSSSRDFVAISRLADITDILGSLQVVHRGLSPMIRTVDVTQDDQIETKLEELRKYVSDIYAQERGGRKFTSEQAETLGAEAQKRATAITGQISQIAARLNVKIQS